MSRDLPYTVAIHQVPPALAIHQTLIQSIQALLGTTVNYSTLRTVSLSEFREPRRSRTPIQRKHSGMITITFMRTVRSTHALSSDIRNRCGRIEKPPVDSALSLNYAVHRPVACQVGMQMQ